MSRWITELSEGEELGPECIVDRGLGLGFAVTHGTKNLVVEAIYDLAGRWNEHAAGPRKEVDAAFGGNVESVVRSIATNLSKLDSFIRGSQRMSPGSAFRSFYN